MTNIPCGEERKLSDQDIQLVKTRVEQCLQHYMSKKEVINTLIVQDSIPPGFTELVWQRLEEENQEFFKAYYLKLLVKDQITEFNRLLSEQVDVMHRIGLSGIGQSNGSHVSPTKHIRTTFDARPLKLNGMQPEKVLNDVRPCMPVLPSRSMFLGLDQSTMMNGKIVKTEGGSSQPFDFGPNSNYVETRPNIVGDASVNAQCINDTMVLDGGDASSFAFMEQFQQNLSLPEFGSDFPTDLVESYCRSPFPGADGNNLVHPNVNIESLDPETENLRFLCFGGD